MAFYNKNREVINEFFCLWKQYNLKVEELKQKSVKCQCLLQSKPRLINSKKSIDEFKQYVKSLQLEAIPANGTGIGVRGVVLYLMDTSTEGEEQLEYMYKLPSELNTCNCVKLVLT